MIKRFDNAMRDLYVGCPDFKNGSSPVYANYVFPGCGPSHIVGDGNGVCIHFKEGVFKPNNVICMQMTDDGTVPEYVVFAIMEKVLREHHTLDTMLLNGWTKI